MTEGEVLYDQLLDQFVAAYDACRAECVRLRREVERLRRERDLLLDWDLYEHDGGWGIRGLFCRDEPFPTRDAAAARLLDYLGRDRPGPASPIGVIFAPPPAVCVAVVVEDAAGRVLLLKRSESGTWPGMWCLVGGHVAAGETLEGCCRRELAEETGLRVRRLAFECITECLGPPHLIGVVYRALGVSEVPRNAEPEQHDAIGWFAPDAMPSPLMPGVVQWLEQRRDPGPIAERYPDGDSVRTPEDEP